MGYTYDDIEDLKIAVSEACTNAVQHAYKDENKGEVSVRFGVFEDRLEVIVADQGDSFDFDQKQERISGRTPFAHSRSIVRRRARSVFNGNAHG